MKEFIGKFKVQDVYEKTALVFTVTEDNRWEHWEIPLEKIGIEVSTNDILNLFEEDGEGIFEKINQDPPKYAEVTDEEFEEALKRLKDV